MTCSNCEMGGRGKVGLEIELDRVLFFFKQKTAYEIMLSESQERMLLVAEKGREQDVFRVFEKWGLDAVEVGHVTRDNVMRVRQHGELVAEIPNEALTDDAPLYKRPLERWEPPVEREMPAHIRAGQGEPQGLKPSSSNGSIGTAEAVPFQTPTQNKDLTPEFKQLLSSANICSKLWVWQQDDSIVQHHTVEETIAVDAV